MHDLVVRDLEQARNRTLGLTDLDDPRLVAQHDPLKSPLVRDLAHVGQQEEQWLLRGGDQARPGRLPPAVDALNDAFKHPCAERPSPPLPPVEARAYDHEVRGRVFDLIVPVSNRQWREFMADGGYQRQDLWSARGRAHRTGADLERPLFWTADGTGRRFGAEGEVPASSPCSTSATSRPLERHRSASCAPAAASRASP
jgi:formylglycine-generating enzyme required for sulfatase activity